jgi:hypothetical protein
MQPLMLQTKLSCLLKFKYLLLSINPNGKGKGKVHPRTGHEGSEGELRYSSTLFLTLALDEGVWSTLRPGRFTPGKETRYPLLILI